jgi:hypothetical protein
VGQITYTGARLGSFLDCRMDNNCLENVGRFMRSQLSERCHHAHHKDTRPCDNLHKFILGVANKNIMPNVFVLSNVMLLCRVSFW